MLNYSSANEFPFRYRMLTLACVLVLGLVAIRPAVWAQDGGPSAMPIPEAGDDLDGMGAEADPQSSGQPATLLKKQGINVLTLIYKGGPFMLPIGILSLLVVTFVIERFIGLRRGRVLPDQLVAELGQLGGPQGEFDPRKAYRICQQFPSAASTVIRTMLQRVGRPQSEVQHTVTEASQREAERLYSNVRWLNLATGVAPLMGLLGTVWGMIRAFHDTTLLAPGQNKADYLAEGIYVALVTTLGGLAVAIPAAIFAHYFEGRIQTLFHQIDDLLFNLMPQIERFEGRVRFGRPMGKTDQISEQGEAKTPQPPPVEVKSPKLPVPK